MADFIILVMTSRLGATVTFGILIVGAIVYYFFRRNIKGVLWYLLALFAASLFGLLVIIIAMFILTFSSYGSPQTPLAILIYGPYGMLISGVLFLGLDIYKQRRRKTRGRPA